MEPHIDWIMCRFMQKKSGVSGFHYSCKSYNRERTDNYSHNRDAIRDKHGSISLLIALVIYKLNGQES